MNFNPLNLFQMLSNNSPKDIIMNMFKQQIGNNPIINNLINMAEQGNNSGVENFARNICKEKGIDFDTQFSNFMNQFNKKNNN